MLPRRRLSAAAPLWPLAAVAGFALWFTSPLWSTTDRVFAGKLSTDNVVTPWFYDFVARSWRSGASVERLSDFNFPAPSDRMREFPDVADAMLAAPLHWLLDWPQQWNATLSLAVTINGLGLALLARAIGCGPLGVLASGALGVMLRPVWSDLVMGRLNVAFPGIVALSLAALLASSSGRRLPRRVLAAAAAAALGALAALIYPPLLVLLAPLGLLAVAPALRGGLWGVLLPLLSIGAALLLAESGLRAIYDSQLTRAAGTSCERMCVNIYSAVALRDLARVAVDPRQGLSLSGLVWPGWWLAPLALLHPRRRVAAVLLAVTAFLAAMSLGPCPRMTSTELLPAVWTAQLRDIFEDLWCLAAPLHDYGRFASAAAVILALLSGLGADAIWRRGRLGRAAASVLVAATLWQVGALVLGEVLDAEKWHVAVEPETARFLRTAEPGPVAELPFDRSQQFLSVLYAPGAPRINPIQPVPHPTGTHNPAIEWLFDLGWSRPPQSTISLEQLRISGVRWIFYDAERCAPQPCPPSTVFALRALLGPPRPLDSGVLVWDVRQAP